MRKLFFLAVIFIAGCGDLHREDAVGYVDAVHDALIVFGSCESKADCTSNGRVFWEGAKSLGSKVHVNLYKTIDHREILQVQKSIMAARGKLKVGVILTVFSSAHGQPKKQVFQSLLE